jgi:UTP:GlnB (protein PII) uridylyltransferase
MTSDQGLLDEAVRRVVDVAHPDRIILFGSAARGQMGPDSDLDLLVVKSWSSTEARQKGTIMGHRTGYEAMMLAEGIYCCKGERRS